MLPVRETNREGRYKLAVIEPYPKQCPSMGLSEIVCDFRTSAVFLADTDGAARLRCRDQPENGSEAETRISVKEISDSIPCIFRSNLNISQKSDVFSLRKRGDSHADQSTERSAGQGGN